MKKLATISLFIFGVVIVSVLTAGLVFYQNKKDNKIINDQTGILVSNTINQIQSSDKSIILNVEEITKHNKKSDCWMLINGKVYNITSYFGSHPGGNSKMTATCGIDATDAYMTQNPNATSSGGRSAHSSNAINLLTKYYVGDLNQTIGNNKIVETNSIAAPAYSGEDDDYEDEDD
jgi:cytochrome b involved in lipid metabolism